MEKKIKDIVAKVRELYKEDQRLKDLVLSTAILTIKEVEIGEFVIENLIFDNEGWLFFYKDCIIYSPLEGEIERIVEYNGFDELLNL